MKTIRFLFYYVLLCGCISLYGSEEKGLPVLDYKNIYKVLEQSDSCVIQAVISGQEESRNQSLGLNGLDAFISSKGEDHPINAADKNGITPVIAALYTQPNNSLLFFLIAHGADPCGAINGYTPLDLVSDLLTVNYEWAKQYWDKSRLHKLKQSLECAMGVKHIMNGCRKCNFKKPAAYDPDTEKFILE